MANGETYRGYRMIAASNKFPLGSIVEVVNISNGKRVRVKITDRGYFSHRHIDLSIRAFKALDKTKKGKIKVKVRRVR